ncbi:prolow-density lipoprotein receptor-related protein 1-like [Ruditapes philippinarum]|uniref:prolow-density lipoprotein receptor-related protein 1-like n=1 Tax=Ruditapes philippinarum TaxID=129788 RepID=UPI00295AE8E0|nr:prolow-density lipoprotein receptor-related protein 1-like [Ruditapes philippinarum]
MCYMMKAMFFVTTLMVGIFLGSNGQTTDPETWPEERGLIVTTLNRYGWRTPVQLRHLPVFPGHENYSGTVPGVTFSNRNIHFVSIDVDYRTKCIYMYEYHLRTIVVGTNFSKDLTDMKFQNIHMGVSRGNIQVAVDWLSHTVYWSDSKFRWIVAAPGESDKIDMDYYKIVVDTHLEAPDGLTIDPLEGLLFWSDNGKHPKIERSDLKGDNRHTIVSKHLQSPLTLEADIFDKRIYWIDSLSESILSSTYDGNDVMTIQKIPNSGLFDLAIFRDVVYISDIQSGYIYTLNTTKGIHLGKQESTIIKIFPEIFYGLAVYSEEKQPLKEKDYCAEKNCDHMCISTKTGAECVCSEGFELDVNTGKCKEIFDGYHKAIVVANKTHICLTDIRSFAQADHEYDCRFTVVTKYSFTDSPSKFKRKKRQTFLSTPPVGITEDLLSSTAKQVTSEPNVASPSTQRYTRPRTLSRFSRYTRRRTTPTAWTGPVTKPMLNKTTISPVTQRPSTRVTTNRPIDFIMMFDMDMEKRIFFFATESNTIYGRPIDLPIENDMKEAIVSASGNISGLAYDADDGDNLYWCESDKGDVWVVNVETKASRIVNRDYSTFAGAHNLVIISNHSMLAMVTGTNSYKYIKTLTMDGSRVNTISHGMSTISGLTYDKSEKVLYYINGYYLYKVSIITKNTDFVFMSVDDGAFGLILYQNYLAWVHPGDFFVTSYDLVTGSRTRNGYLGNTSMEIVDMKVLDQRLQSTNYTNPCAFEDGGCSQICITAYVNDVMTPVCECRLGYFLDDDNLTCISNVVDDNFIIAVDMTNNELLQISLDDNTINAIPNPDNDQYKGVFFDISTQKLIWTENYDSKMYTSNLNGTEERELANLGYQGYLRRLDKDMTTGNIFFTAFYDDFIGVVTPSGEALVLFSVYTTTSLGDIVLHPGKGVMYYTRDYYFSTYIGRADMDGKNEVELIKGHHVEKPSGVAIDFIHDHLYWSDSHYDTIQQCDLNGENCLTIINMTGTFRDEGIQDIVTDGVYLYYSAYRKDHIVRVDLTPPYERAIVGQSPGMGNLESIAFYSSSNKNKQAVSVACRARGGRGDCSTICLPTMSGRTCACENGAVLKADGRTCNNVFQCTELLQQVVEVNGITTEIDITFSSLCPRHLHDECRYRCPTNFVPLFDTLLTCTNVGWDLESKTLCEDVKCPSQVPNGEVIGECSLRVGEECSFQCNNGYRATLSQRKLKCTSDGHWDIADIACSAEGKAIVYAANEHFIIPEMGANHTFKCSDKIENGELDNDAHEL